MSNLFTEDTYEQAVIELFEGMGYEHIYAPDYDRDYTSPFLDAVLYGSPDGVEHGGTMRGLGLLDTKTVFKEAKTRTRINGHIAEEHNIYGLSAKWNYSKDSGKRRGTVSYSSIGRLWNGR